MKKLQKGFALVVAMLIIAIATMLATQMFYQQQLTVRRTLNQLQSEQLYQLAISTENWIKVILQEDGVKNKIDYFGDNWAQPLALFDAEVAVIKTRIVDYQSCFNINNLVENGQAQEEQIKILQNLMTQLNLNPDLVWPLVDWLDADNEPYPNGAEWETYSRLTPSYRAANYRIIELNELYAISGWKAPTINALLPYICALPPAPQLTATGRTFKEAANTGQENTTIGININTASELLLRSLSPQMQYANLRNILEYRKNKGYNSVAVFLTQLDMDNSSDPKLSSTIKKELLSVDSHYFMLEYSAWLDQLEQNYRILIYRNNKDLSTVSRLPYY